MFEGAKQFFQEHKEAIKTAAVVNAVSAVVFVTVGTLVSLGLRKLLGDDEVTINVTTSDDSSAE